MKDLALAGGALLAAATALGQAIDIGPAPGRLVDIGVHLSAPPSVVQAIEDVSAAVQTRTRLPTRP